MWQDYMKTSQRAIFEMMIVIGRVGSEFDLCCMYIVGSPGAGRHCTLYNVFLMSSIILWPHLISGEILWKIWICVDIMRLIDEDLFKDPWKSNVLKWTHCDTLIASFSPVLQNVFWPQADTYRPAAWIDDAVDSREESRCALMLWGLNQN